MTDVCIELALEPRHVPPPDAAHLFAGRQIRAT
jgi:hypothetical protein